MIKPKPYKLVCQSCRYKKIVTPKSDALNPSDMILICPKCRGDMKKFTLSNMDKVLNFFYN
jgi:Zn finger protein HypA/HybF involved in hydrogenase expression